MAQSYVRKAPLRISVPPYAVGTGPDGIPLLNFDGETWSRLEKSCAPSVTEVCDLFVQLRNHLNWSRPTLAAFLGVSVHVLRRWESGQRSPSAAAKRLVWLLHVFLTDPGKLTSALDLIVWGKGDELVSFSEALNAEA